MTTAQATKPLITKYRPTDFNEVIGQDTVVNSLQAIVNNPSRSHVYLFTGNAGCGKTTLAKILATKFGAHPTDIIEHNAAVTNGVEACRDLASSMAYAPMRGPSKVLILDECHILSKQAWDAFLKPTEDAPPHAYYIFCTTEAGKVPATLKTRATDFEFRKVDLQLLVSYGKIICKWEGINLDDESIGIIAEAADGCVRDLLKSLDKCRSAKDVNEVRHLCAASLAITDIDPLGQIIKLLLNENKNWPQYSQLITSIEDYNGVRSRLKSYMGKVALGQGGLKLAKILDAIDKMPPFPSKSEAPADLALMVLRVILT